MAKDTEKKRYYMAGVWDLFHVGHLNAIKEARNIAGDDELIIGVVTDESVYSYKGKRAVIRSDQRFEIIEALKYPDNVVYQYVQFSVKHMRSLGINTVIIGDDWQTNQPPSLKELTKHFEVIYLPRTAGISTSEIKERIINAAT